jgi:hypothetical protein
LLVVPLQTRYYGFRGSERSVLLMITNARSTTFIGAIDREYAQTRFDYL